MTRNRRFTLIRRPRGQPVADDFRIDEVPVPALADGEMLIANDYASLDPAIRGWLDDAPSYLPPVPLGAPVRASTLGRIVESRSPGFNVGDWVVGLNAIECYSVARTGGFTARIDPDATPHVTHHLSVLGAVGLTAYFGLTEVARIRAGETVLVTGAAGAVGSLVGQIARIMGCRTIGIAGGAEKCRRLTEDYGYDAAVDYQGRDAAALESAIRAVTDGVDAIFENVGGAPLEAGLLCLKRHGRVALCGLISEYNASSAVGLRNLWQLIVRSASISGFLVSDYMDRFAEGSAVLAGWVRNGQLRVDEHVEVGIDNALPAFLRLFNGTNTGKLMLRISPEP